MASEVVHWCDVHLRDHDERVPVDGDAIMIMTIDQGSPRRVEVCTEHKKALDDMRAFLDRYGVALPKVDRKATGEAAGAHAGTDALECPLCEERKVYKSRVGLRDHVRRVHDTTLGALEDEVAAASGVIAEDKAYPCEVCGEVCRSKQGLGAHKRKHGIKGASATALAARRRRQTSEEYLAV